MLVLKYIPNYQFESVFLLKSFTWRNCDFFFYFFYFFASWFWLPVFFYQQVSYVFPAALFGHYHQPVVLAFFSIGSKPVSLTSLFSWLSDDNRGWRSPASFLPGRLNPSSLLAKELCEYVNFYLFPLSVLKMVGPNKDIYFSWILISWCISVVWALFVCMCVCL